MDLTLLIDTAIVMAWVVAIGGTAVGAYKLIGALERGRHERSRPIDE